jgi:hypothetical protein
MIQASTEASGSIWRRSGPSRANGCDPAGVARRSGGSPRWPLQVDHDLSADELSQQPGGTLVRGCRPYEGDERPAGGPRVLDGEAWLQNPLARLWGPWSRSRGRMSAGLPELHSSREQALFGTNGVLG